MNEKVVLDNSALCRYRIREDRWQNVKPLIEAIHNREVIAYAPPHLLVEFYQVARRKAAPLRSSSRAVKRHADWLESLPLQFVPVDSITDARELRLMVARGADSYDAVYMRLARQSGYPLCTCDDGIVGLADKFRDLSVFDLNARTFSIALESGGR